MSFRTLGATIKFRAVLVFFGVFVDLEPKRKRRHRMDADMVVIDRIVQEEGNRRIMTRSKRCVRDAVFLLDSSIQR